MQIPHEKSEIPGGVVTISVGVAVAMATAAEASAELILCADRSLYMAKNAGRAQVQAVQAVQADGDNVEYAERRSG